MATKVTFPRAAVISRHFAFAISRQLKTGSSTVNLRNTFYNLRPINNFYPLNNIKGSMIVLCQCGHKTYHCKTQSGKHAHVQAKCDSRRFGAQ